VEFTELFAQKQLDRLTFKFFLRLAEKALGRGIHFYNLARTVNNNQGLRLQP
jgi:hypothetical protein